MGQAAPSAREDRDDLDDYIAEQTARNAEFPVLMGEASQRKRLLRDLAAMRKSAGLSRTTLAARMHTSVAVVARLEQGSLNTTLATVQRYTAAVGKRLEWRLVEAPMGGDGDGATK